jgi:hypothetical protein
VVALGIKDVQRVAFLATMLIAVLHAITIKHRLLTNPTTFLESH